MKHTQRIVCLIIASITSTMFAMESMEHFVELQQQPINATNITTTIFIDEKINKQYAKNLFPDTLVALTLTEKDKLDILNIVNTCCKEDKIEFSKQLINTLYKNNVFFEAAIDQFSNFASQNINQVTYETLNKVDNPASKQPIDQLNTIPQPIKKYVMKTAYKKICLPYDIPLQHNSIIRLFTIHPKSDTAASCCNNNSLHIWDLKTGNITQEINIQHTTDVLQFNQNGSLLATVHPYQDRNNHEKYCIKIRNTKTAQQLYSIKLYDRVYHIDFMQSKNTVATFALTADSKENRQDRVLHLWQLNENNQSAHLGSSSPLPWRCEQHVEFLSDKKKYEGKIDEDNHHNIQITTKGRTALHLCAQAIENHTNTDSIHNIKQSQTYKKLTEYEKQLIATKITQQKTLLQKNNLLIRTTQKK